jgi:Rrf2 family protein
VRAGLVEASPGRGGGYRLTRAPDEVTLLEVIEAVEGDIRRRTCVLRADACAADRACGVHDLFAAAQDALLEQLAAATVQDAARGTDEQLRASA